MIWFSADWHLGHTGILLHQSQRMNAFESVEEMDAQLIECINNYVRPNDELFFLGDFCWEASRAGHYRQRLNVRNLHVLQGNHDSNSLRAHVSTMEDMVYRRFTWDGESYRFHLCHYPLLSWQGLHSGAIHLYGHSHGIYENRLNVMFSTRRAMDVGVDAVAYLTGEWRPVSLPEVLKRLVKGGEPSVESRLPGPFEEVNI